MEQLTGISDDLRVVDPPDPAAAMPKPADSPAQFCADFAALLDARGVSLRAAARSGWGKTTIAGARKGPDLPNVDLVVDVLQAIGEHETIRKQWRDRHERLRQSASATSTASENEAPPSAELAAGDQPPLQPAEEVSAEPTTTAQARAADGDSVERDEGLIGYEGGARPKHWSRRRVVAAAAGVVLVAAGGLTWWWVSRSDQPAAASSRTIVVQNKVAFGPTDLEEDRSPSYLAARPIERCANVPGCKLSGTDMGSGDTVEAVCQLQGALLTNADVRSSGVEANPNVAASALWYGVRWPDGRRGYLSEVYVAPMYRGGLQLPPC